MFHKRISPKTGVTPKINKRERTLSFHCRGGLPNADKNGQSASVGLPKRGFDIILAD